jgi:Phenylalanyl tRNA synthetase beta chain CLM domain/tRNA synthetase B5 domain
MPNVDFERARLARRLAASSSSPDAIDLDSPAFAYRLLSQKALIDTQGEEIITLNFMDTLRPELWCVEGLARHIAPLRHQAGAHYGLDMFNYLPSVDARIMSESQHTTWALYVSVESGLERVDDGYFFKKVRDQLGFGSSRQIDVAILPGTQRDITLHAGIDEEDDVLPELQLSVGMHTVVITARDPRIAAWLCFTFACNYLDRGYTLTGYAAPAGAQAVFAKWEPFAFDDAHVRKTFGFAPAPLRFQQVLQGQHFAVQYDAAAQAWQVTPPIFRFDIIHPIDILEEYLVVTHYAEAKPAPLYVPLGMGAQTKRSALEERLVGYMQAYGARQTIGLLLDSYDNAIGHMRHDAPQRLMRLENAVNKHREYLVDSSLPPLLRNAVHPSAPLPPTTFYLFTETDVLDEQRVAHSRWKMGILLVGTEHPFNNAHTLLDALCHHLRLPYTLKRSSSPALIPGRQMHVFVEDMQLGQFGEVHPEVLTNWDLFYPASFIELDLDAILKVNT